MRLIDAQFLGTPWYFSRQMARHLRRLSHMIGRKWVRQMSLIAVHQWLKTTMSHPEHKIWPYLLRNEVIDRMSQVWCAVIACVAMWRGLLSLVVGMGWNRRVNSAFIERPGRSLKHECGCLNAVEAGNEVRAGLASWIGSDNAARSHSALGRRTPAEAHAGFRAAAGCCDPGQAAPG